MAYLVKNGAILTISGDPIVAPVSGSSSVNNRSVQTVTPTESQQIISYSSPYTGLEGVIVQAIPSQYIIPIGAKSITTNGTDIDVTEYATVDVAVPTDFIVTLSWDDNDEIWIPNKTFAELSAAYQAGKDIIAKSDASSIIGVDINRDTLAVSLTFFVSVGWATGPYTTFSDLYYWDSNGYTLNRRDSYLKPQGTKSITANGTGIDVTQYAAVDVAVPTGSTINNKPSQTITPTESQQTIGYSSPYTGLEEVIVDAISSTYVGSGITQRSSTDLTVSGATITAPAGYYAESASKSVTTMTLPTAASSSATSGYTSKATISRSTSDQYINIPPGYNSTGGYYKISAVANGSVTAPATISGTSATLSTGTGTLTLTKTVSVTPSVTTAGYISSGTAGNSEISLTASVTINPTPTASGATVTIPAGYYSSQTTKSVSTMTLPTAASATSSGTSKATIGRSTSNQYINIPVGYNSTAAYYTISAVANGSATGPTSITQSSATVSTGTNTLTLTKQNVSTTPTVSAGYISSATASTATVSLTASVTTKAAATYYPSTSDQTISASQYLTGAQTIKAVVVSGLDASKILSGTTVNIGDSADADRITSVSGSVSFVTYYTGSGTPSSSLGSVGDIYLQTS